MQGKHALSRLQRWRTCWTPQPLPQPAEGRQGNEQGQGLGLRGECRAGQGGTGERAGAGVQGGAGLSELMEISEEEEEEEGSEETLKWKLQMEEGENEQPVKETQTRKTSQKLC